MVSRLWSAVLAIMRSGIHKTIAFFVIHVTILAFFVSLHQLMLSFLLVICEVYLIVRHLLPGRHNTHTKMIILGANVVSIHVDWSSISTDGKETLELLQVRFTCVDTGHISRFLRFSAIQ
jgi:hypothetical protein